MTQIFLSIDKILNKLNTKDSKLQDSNSRADYSVYKLKIKEYNVLKFVYLMTLLFTGNVLKSILL